MSQLITKQLLPVSFVLSVVKANSDAPVSFPACGVIETLHVVPGFRLVFRIVVSVVVLLVSISSSSSGLPQV